MSRITLIRPAYSAQIYGHVYKQEKDTEREIRPPLGLMALGGYLKGFGHEVVIIDGEPELLDEAETVKRVLETRPDIVGVTSTTPEYPFAFEITKSIKQAIPQVITVFGGAHITNLPEHTMRDLDDFVDWGVLWEGEKPLAAIANGNPEDFLWNPGVSRKLLLSPERLTGEELDSFQPDRSILDMSKYWFVDTSVGLAHNDALEMARGCPFACSFCTSRKTLLSNRSIGSVLDEITNSANKYQTKLFMFFDDTFTIHKGRAMELFRGIIDLKKRGIVPADVHFYGFTRANTLHDFELLRLMKDAGFDKVTIGIETGNADILRMTHKGTKKDDYRIAYAMMDELDITKRGSVIIGHPFETEDTIRDSINFVLELDLDEIGVNIMTPYPGQLTFRDAVAAKGIWFSHPIHYSELRGTENIKNSWADYLSVNWHDYWRDHLRWGRSVVETETLSQEALVYWHGRFLQEVYGSEKMATRRQRFIDAGNDDEYWHRPWLVNAQRNRERIEVEKANGRPDLGTPTHRRYTYDPVILRDYQKNELIPTAGRRRQMETKTEALSTAAETAPAVSGRA